MAVPHSDFTATVLDGPLCRAAPAAAWCGKVLVAGGFGPAELYDPLSDRWSPTGPMIPGRNFHTATLLDGAPCREASFPSWCGKVLAAGGADAGSVVAELYDPATSTWQETGSMVTRRGQHAAALLGDGRVFVTGGQTRTPDDDWRTHNLTGTPLGGTEIYDPATGTWSPVASPDTVANGAPQTGPAAAVTLDGPPCAESVPPAWCGQVLVVWVGEAGPRGVGPGVIGGSTAHLYDPVKGSWTLTGQHVASHSGGELTQLGDGTVLFAGGGTAAAERYDPATSQWRPAAAMAHERSEHRAVRLDGPSCAAANPAPSPCGQVLAVGGARAPAELYDPQADRWHETGAELAGRPGLVAARFNDGRVLVAGGDIDPKVGVSSASALLFDPSTSTDPPSVGAVAPSRGPVGGGASVVIRGQGLKGVTAVRFGDTEAASFRVESSTRILAVAPAQGVGTVPVTVSGATVAPGAEPVAPGTRYTYVDPAALPAPTVTGLDPPTTNDGAPTTVTVSGSGFVFSAADTKVMFGSVTAGPVTLVSESVLQVVAPAGKGKVEVTVSTPAGSSPLGRPADGNPAPSSFAYSEGSWSEQGPLSEAECPRHQTRPGAEPLPCRGRFWITTTVLDGPACRVSSPPEWCGQVLVTGGSTHMYCEQGEAVSTVELYNPRTGQWKSVAPLREARYEHTATLLADGRVLVAGGKTAAETTSWDSGCEAIGSAEIYDPALGVWSHAGNMNATRFAHSATLLDGPACKRSPSLCGQVLIAGGTPKERYREPVTSAELFDPGRLEFRTTASMKEGRANHSASVLETGEVMLVGGHGLSAHLSSAELFSPERPTFRLTASMAVERGGHSATVLTGPRCSPRCGQVLVVGGDLVVGRADRFLASAEIYDPAAGTWGPMPFPAWARAGHSATLLTDGRVLVVGSGPPTGAGTEGAYRALATSEIFDPQTATWSPTGTMRTARGIHGAALLDGPECRGGGDVEGAAVIARPAWCGSVLVVGGATSGDGHAPPPLYSVERYAPGPPVAYRPLADAPERSRRGIPLSLVAALVVVAGAAGLFMAAGRWRAAGLNESSSHAR